MFEIVITVIETATGEKKQTKLYLVRKEKEELLKYIKQHIQDMPFVKV